MKMKKVLSLIMSVLMLVSLALAPSAALQPSYTLGDVNGDGKINAKDSLIIRKCIAGLITDVPIEAADVSGDGNIDMKDVLLVRKHIARIITIVGRPITDNYLSDITLDGVSLSSYTVVLPEIATVYETYAAELLVDFVKDKSGITMPVAADCDGISSYEILIGETNRPESRAALTELGADEFILKKDGSKIVMLGASYMIGAPVGAFTYDYITYDPALKNQVLEISGLPEDGVPQNLVQREAKNAILMIGDGMGMNHIPVSLSYNAARRLETDYTEFSAFEMPHIASMKTASQSTVLSGGSTPTDSAAGATAFACGIKTLNHYLGMDSSGNARQNVRELAASLGKRNAVLTTDPKEGATPAAFTVHIDERSETEAIAAAQALITDCDYFKGDIGDDLLTEVIYALDLISTNSETGFFTMIEEAKIDTYAHYHDPATLVHCMNRFNKAIQYALVFTAAHPDTILIVTADHETGGLKPDGTFTSNGHTGVDVYCFAMGPGSENVEGTIDNTYIAKLITADWGVDFPN